MSKVVFKTGGVAMAIVFALALHMPFSLAGEQGGPVTAERAQEIALAETGGGTVRNMGKYNGGDGYYYRFEIVGNDGAYHVVVAENDGRLQKFIRKYGSRGYKGNADGISGGAPSNTGVQATRTVMTREQAREIAFKQTGGGTVIESDVDYKRSGRVVYEFEIINNDSKFDIDIDGTSGDVLKFKQKRKRSYHTAVEPTPSVRRGGFPPARLTAESAQALAREKVGGGSVSEYKLDYDDGRLTHEVAVIRDGVEYEVEIDDASGVIVELSID